MYTVKRRTSSEETYLLKSKSFLSSHLNPSTASWISNLILPLKPGMLSGRLTEVLKMAARSVKKEHLLPAVALDLLKLSLKEDTFQLFWNNAITSGMLKEQPGPTQ